MQVFADDETEGIVALVGLKPAIRARRDAGAVAVAAVESGVEHHDGLVQTVCPDVLGQLGE